MIPPPGRPQAHAELAHMSAATTVSASAIPTLSGWVLLLLALAIAGLGVVILRE